MKSIVMYYSRSGNNRYLAEKIANVLKSDIEQIVPSFNNPLFQMLFTLMKTDIGIRVKHHFEEYEIVIVVGPIWMGMLIAPLYDVINKNRKNIKRLSFATCCGSDETNKDGKFGYNKVFSSVKKLMGDKLSLCEAFPIGLALPADKRKNDEAIMKTRLSDSNFKGELETKLHNFIDNLKRNSK